MATKVQVGTLQGADGSATFSTNGIAVIASINGPLEVQRRDEIPEEAAIEVTIRPAAGVGGVRERHFESIIHKLLHHIIKVEMHPRTLIQVTLQIIAVPDEGATAGRPNQAASMLYLLPPLLNAAMLALLSTSVPLSTTMTSILMAVDANGSIITNPSISTLNKASSVHALAFASRGSLLMTESEGSFDLKTWEAVAEAAESRSCETTAEADREDSEMSGTGMSSLAKTLRASIEDKLLSAESWRQGIK